MTDLSRLKQYFQQSWQRLCQDWQVMGEASVPASELNQTFLQASLPTVNFYLLLAIASVIGTLGLLTNSAATIIGAMIIAPLLNPIATLAYTVSVVEPRLLERALLKLVTGTSLVILMAFLSTSVLGTKVVGAEILARTEPNLLDLGVAVATGAAASLAYARRSIATALPGVAIAAALVPPLCVAGIGLALEKDVIIDLGLYFSRQGQVLNLASGAFLLFLTNLAGMVFCGGLVFLLQGYGNWRSTIARLSLTIALVVLVSWPLSQELQSFLLRNKVLESLVKFEQTYPDRKEWVAPVQYADIYIVNREQQIYIQVDVMAPSGLISQGDIDLAQEFLSQELEKPVEFQLNLLPFYILKKEPLLSN